MRGPAYLAAAAPAALLAATLALGCHKTPPAPAPKTLEWQLLASELPSALLSVGGRSSKDVYAVGADKGHGPLVLHFDGNGWTELHTGTNGDLWWVQALAGGPVLMAGANATVLRFDGRRFERMKTPGAGSQTIYGVWGTDAEHFYAVGNAGGKSGFVWRYHDGAFENEALPASLARMPGGDVPGFFKVFGLGDDVWVVGAAGALLHRKGGGPFAVVPATTKDTLFTVHGVGDRIVAVGGSGNGVILEGANGVFHDASPPASGLIQGVYTTAHGDWATGERGAVYTRSGAGPFTAVDHGLPLAPTTALHSVFVDDAGGVWCAGGNVLTPALDDGVLLHYGDAVSEVVIEEDGG